MDFNLAGTVILSGIGIVFLVLILLTVIVDVFGRIMSSTSKKNNDTAVEAKPQPVAAIAPVATPVAVAPVKMAQDGIPDEVIAVISAAIAATMGGPESGFVIRSVKRASGASVGRSAWSMAGMQQNTASF